MRHHSAAACCSSGSGRAADLRALRSVRVGAGVAARQGWIGGERLLDVVGHGQPCALEPGEPLAQRRDPRVGADDLGQHLVPGALGEGVARTCCADGPVELGLVGAGGADGADAGGAQVVLVGPGHCPPHGKIGPQVGVLVLEEGLCPDRCGGAGPSPSLLADGVDLLTHELVVGGRERSPVVGLGQPGGDAGQPGQRPVGGRGRVRVVWPGRGEFGDEVVDAGVEHGRGVACVGQRTDTHGGGRAASGGCARRAR